MPIRWETDVAPRLGERAQEIVNDEIVRPSDILIGKFWTRIGTPAGTADSGTLEEIEEFRAGGKEAMLNISTAHMPQRGHDPAQYQRLLEYKDEMQKQGITKDFSRSADLGAQLGRHLTGTVRRLENVRREREAKESSEELPEESVATRAEILAVRANREAITGNAVARRPMDAAGDLTVDRLINDWPRILRDVHAVNRRVEALLKEVDPKAVHGRDIELVTAYDFHRTKLNADDVLEFVIPVLERFYGAPIRYRVYLPNEQDFNNLPN